MTNTMTRSKWFAQPRKPARDSAPKDMSEYRVAALNSVSLAQIEVNEPLLTQIKQMEDSWRTKTPEQRLQPKASKENMILFYKSASPPSASAIHMPSDKKICLGPNLQALKLERECSRPRPNVNFGRPRGDGRQTSTRRELPFRQTWTCIEGRRGIGIDGCGGHFAMEPWRFDDLYADNGRRPLDRSGNDSVKGQLRSALKSRTDKTSPEFGPTNPRPKASQSPKSSGLVSQTSSRSKISRQPVERAVQFSTENDTVGKSSLPDQSSTPRADSIGPREVLLSGTELFTPGKMDFSNLSRELPPITSLVTPPSPHDVHLPDVPPLFMALPSFGSKVIEDRTSPSVRSKGTSNGRSVASQPLSPSTGFNNPD